MKAQLCERIAIFSERVKRKLIQKRGEEIFENCVEMFFDGMVEFYFIIFIFNYVLNQQPINIFLNLNLFSVLLHDHLFI